MSSSTTAPQEYTRFSLPGLNLPLNWTPHATYTNYSVGNSGIVPPQGDGKNLFRTALNAADVDSGYTVLRLTPLREFTMLDIMDSLTDKAGWEEKVFDETISEKWKAEALATEDTDVTQAMVDWVIAELRWRADEFKKTGRFSVYNGDVVKSDSAISEDIKLSLRAAVRPLEDVPEKHKDYHPGSDGKVLDIVHPSLFPLIYGRSRVLEDRLIGLGDCIANCGKGKTVPIRSDEETKLDRKGQMEYGHWNSRNLPEPYGKHFQWLPCEVDISGDHTKITSYINNLHPRKYSALYSIIENIIDKTIPLWNQTLTPLKNRRRPWRFGEISLEFDPNPDTMSDSEFPQQEDGEDEDEYYERRQEWADDQRETVLPEPDIFSPPEAFKEMVDLRKDYGHHGLQVIVKLANIELTPEKPEYEGGTWHVEGQLNEHIIATALYYYDNENITESHLAFRQQSATDDADEMGYPQSVHGWLQDIFGCEQGEPAVQEVGAVVCSEGRLLTFPNILQHQVQPFELEDPTKKGHRKILALFLVDPGMRIISTANVPPQQKEWWSEEVDRQMKESGKAIGKLSNELKDKVFGDVEDFPIGMDEAKELRLKLMEERKKYVIASGKQIFEKNVFSLCEH